MKAHASPSRLGLLVDLAGRLEADALRDGHELHRRDRHLGQQAGLDALKGRPIEQLEQWLTAMDPPPKRRPGQKVEGWYRIVCGLLLIVGLIAGWIVAAGLFAYDGTQPVNIVRLLAVLIGGQLLLLVLLGVLMLPQGLLRWVPGLAAVQEALSMLSPGRIVPWVMQRLSQVHREAIERFAGVTRSHHGRFGHVEKWAVVRAGQGFAVAFNIGALMACLYLITFSDLAFGWSTTLHVEAETMGHITTAVAAPWAAWVPAAVPSAELIEQTQFYRGDGRIEDPRAGTRWWPFIVAALLTWGLLPRLLSLPLAAWRLRRACDRAILELPGAAEVLQRLNSPLVETHGHGSPQAAADSDETLGGDDAAAVAWQADPATADGEVFAIDWAGLGLARPDIEQLVGRAVGGRLGPLVRAGGAQPVEADDRIIEQAAASGEAAAVLVLVKAWEPPLLDLTDFLTRLRQALGPRRPVLLAPLGKDGQGQAAAPGEQELSLFARWVAAAGDPQLRLALLVKEKA